MTRLHPLKPIYVQDQEFSLELVNLQTDEKTILEIPIQEPFKFGEITFSNPYTMRDGQVCSDLMCVLILPNTAQVHVLVFRDA
jgi:hypothetical protein